MRYLRYALKIFNPAIWLINLFMFLSHGETYRHHSSKYERYDFNNDLQYF